MKRVIKQVVGYHLNVLGRIRPRDGGLSRFPPQLLRRYVVDTVWSVVLAMALLVALFLAVGCGTLATPTAEPVAENDLAVCDAYQHLVDAWPVDSEAVHAAGSAQEIYQAIEAAGAALVTAGQSADDPELARVGESVGEAAVKFIQMDESARQVGFVPFFEESHIQGEALSSLCAEIGRPISLP
jgi:hypothetical protein